MKIYVMVGNIGSGKTTLVKKILVDHPDIVVISRDALRYMVGAGKYVFNSELESHIFEAARSMIQLVMQGEKFDILVDETNISVKNRRDYLDLAEWFGYEAIAIEMPHLCKKICVDRRMRDPHDQDDRSIWEGVWDKFNAIYEGPTKEEGFSRISEAREWDNG